MVNAAPLTSYLRGIEGKLATGDATEHTHRSTLEALIEALGDGIQAINEPRRIACGAPDLIVVRGQTPIGTIEAKDVGTDLDAAEHSEQLKRYRDSLHNLILTDYLTFRWYVDGELRDTARLARLTRDGAIKRHREGPRAVADLLHRFCAQQLPTIGQPDELAQRMAALARMIRELIEETFRQESEHGSLHAQLQGFREALIPNLTPAQFADMYAQTITYGLFAARVRVPAGQAFTREKAAWNLPRTNPFLRRLFNEIAGPDLDERIAWVVDDLAYLLARADMAEVLRDFGRRTRHEDPVVHFYETFLAAYDPDMRQARGVYYTPEPVVSYIVRSIDYLLKNRFHRRGGLADQSVFILDPAVGTATFLYFVIQEIHEYLRSVGVAGVWNDYVDNHLLPRVFGFELLMAPYTVAHMKLGILLQETGYDFGTDRRLGIYLTNALEEPVTRTQRLGFAGFISEEANAAARVKRQEPIMVVLGNPPYAVSSANQGDYIEDLMDRYKQAVRDERNIQPLSDDYIKFVRFAHDRIERTGHGVVGMITNHTYVSGLIHRGMREELLRSFDEIYLLNLHGNALVGEAAPDGGPDENVFDIRQGVAIALFVKLADADNAKTFEVSETSKVYYADLWGRREGKYQWLMEHDLSTTQWERLEPQPPYYFFVPKDFDLLSEYERGWSVPDIFPVHSSGIKTHRDHFVIDVDEDRLRERIAALRDEALSDREIAERFNLQDTASWKLTEARAELQAWDGWAEAFTRCLYRPFDVQPIYYADALIDRPRHDVMRHLLHENLALITVRQLAGGHFRHVFATHHPGDGNAISISSREYNYYFPLYVYNKTAEAEPRRQSGSAFNLILFDEQEAYQTRHPNLSRPFIAAVEQTLDLRFVSDGKGDLTTVDDPAAATSVGPEDLLHYAYAVFHAPTYRERYAEFLKIDFPRLPLTSDRALFAALAQKGEAIVALHLMDAPRLDRSPVRFPVADANQVASRHPRYLPPGEPEPGSGEPLKQGRVYINATQYFEPIDPAVWAFEIGGYQVLHKWLKDRQGRALSFDDVQHYRRIVVALQETLRLMDAIDETIPQWPMA
jgi:predicted helicase